MLKVRDKAPNFTLPDSEGNSVSLTDFSGRKIVLWFFPKASTPGWIIEGQGFRDEFQNFNDLNVQIIGCSADSPKKQKKFCDKQGFQYFMLCDESHKMLEAYDVWGKKSSWDGNIWGFLGWHMLSMNKALLKMYIRK